MKHGLLLFFNHPFRKVRLFLEDFYRDRFDEVHVITPPENAQENSSKSITYYYQGSYEFGSAFSYLLGRPEIFSEMDWVTIVHDDVMISPAFRERMAPQLAQRPDCVAPSAVALGTHADWPWDSRMVGRAFCSKDPWLGQGVDNPLRSMAELYTQSKKSGAEPTRLTLKARDLLNPGGRGAVTRKFVQKHRSFTVDFGVPLRCANSDFFVVRKDRFDRFCHDAGVLSRCGLFPEVAVPTALDWMSERISFFRDEQLGWIYAGPKVEAAEFQITDLASIPAYFDRHPEKIAIHPIKMSRFLP
jgi:hypothetical protein